MYLIYGESFRLINEEIKKIVKDNTNIIIMDLTLNSLEDILTEATYVSMFQEQKFIIVKNSLFFTSKKETDIELELLTKYMNNPVSLSTIIFTAYEKIDQRKKITKAFKEKYKIISVNELTNDDLVTKVREIIKKKDYKINTEVIQYILNCCQNNFDLIYNELNKIFLYYNNPQEIKIEDVKNIISKSLQDNNFKFIEAVINKNWSLSLKILDDLYALKVDPIALIMLLAREYRLMYSVNILMSEGYRKNNISKELNLQEWQVDKLLKKSSNYYNDNLKNYLKKLANIDFKIKNGSMDKFLGLKTFLLEIE